MLVSDVCFKLGQWAGEQAGSAVRGSGRRLGHSGGSET